MSKLVLPNHYDPKNSGEWAYRPNHRRLLTSAEEWRRMHSIKASMTDKVKVTVLLIDCQKDFCLPPVFENNMQVGGGALYVGGRSGTGAIDDSRRIAEFIYRNLSIITHLRVTLDTHFAYQIFSPSFWVMQDGSHPAPFTVMTVDEIESGKYQPNPAVAGFLAGGNIGWLRQQVIHYARELAKAGKYALIMWPEHCILGDEGHALVGTVQEARMFHAYVRGIQAEAEVKGGNPLTENYSVLGPEVLTRWDGKGALAQRNARFIQTLLESDYVLIGGQAASHCVAWTVNDLLTEIQAKAPEMAQKVFVLKDCMSAVTVPDGKGGFYADYTPDFEQALKTWDKAGVNLVNSTDDVTTWKGFNL